MKGARGSGIIMTSLALKLETKIDKVRYNGELQANAIYN